MALLETPNPSNALLAWNWEDIAGVPRRTGWHYVEFDGETLANTAEVLPRTFISRDEEEPEPLDSKITSAGELRFDNFNPEADWWLFAALLGKGVLDEPEVDAFRLKLYRAAVGLTFPRTLSFRIWRDDGMAQQFAFCRVSQIALTVADRALSRVVATIVPIAGDYWDDSVLETGTGTAFPIVRGGPIDEQFGPLAEDESQNAWFKTIAQTADSWTFQAKIGDAAAYGGNQTIPRGEWFRFADQDGVLVGSLGNAPQVYVPTAGNLVVNDEHSVARRRGEWVPTFPDSIAVNEIYSKVVIDDVEQEMDSFSLAIAMPTEARFGIGARRARRTRQRGQQTTSGTLNREALSLDMRRRLELGYPMDLRVHMRSGVPIGTTGLYDYSGRLIMPNCKLSGATPSVESRDAYNEAINFTAHRSEDVDYPAGITYEGINDIGDPLAA